jgi:GNAT superfamily N-acetyltransferase
VDERQSFRSEVVEPHLCTPARLAQFRQLVMEGGEVDAHTLPALIKRALALAFVRDGVSVVGVGALKRPNASYRNRVFANAKSSLAPKHFEFELGWIYVCPSARGKKLTSPMVKDLLQQAKGRPVYATSRVDNAPMHASLVRCGFRKEGSPYPSSEHEVDIQLFALRGTPRERSE